MLRAHKHLTKKELKKDPFLIFIAQATDYIQREWMKLGSIIFAVVAVFIVGMMVKNGSERAEMSAYDRAISSYYTNAPESIDLLKQYADKYSGTPRGTQIMLQLANYYVSENDYNSAKEYYIASTKDISNDQIFGFNAYNGLGAVYEEQGQYTQAGETYEAFLNKFANSSFVDIMHMNAAKAYLTAGDTTAAKTHFSALADMPNDSELKQEASFYLELIS